MGIWSKLTNIFQMGWFNHQAVNLWTPDFRSINSMLVLLVNHRVVNWMQLQIAPKVAGRWWSGLGATARLPLPRGIFSVFQRGQIQRWKLGCIWSNSTFHRYCIYVSTICMILACFKWICILYYMIICWCLYELYVSCMTCFGNCCMNYFLNHIVYDHYKIYKIRFWLDVICIENNMLLLFFRNPVYYKSRHKPTSTAPVPTVILSRHTSKACVVSALQEPAKPPAASLGRD